jgi:small subunit ribosomal protein S8e
LEKRQQIRKLDPHIEEQFGSGRLLASISSRPGQCGRADGYVTLLLHLFLVVVKYG